MSNFINLPDETILEIISWLDPLSISRSQQVCRKLHKLVPTSPYLFYVLTLHSLGYALPLVPRLGLTIAECVELLYAHKVTWSCFDKIPMEKYDLNPAPGETYKYAGGVFAQGLGNESDRQNMHFYQLPSKNTGVEFKEWAFYDLDWNVLEFTMDPDQNLLVFLQLPPPDQVSFESFEFNIHIRTLDNNDAHPAALLPTITGVVRHEPTPEDDEMTPVEFLGFNLEISGSLLAVLLSAGSIGSLPPQIIVWDWHRAVEVARVLAVHSPIPSFNLLSQGAILLTQYFQERREVTKDPQFLVGETYGALVVYRFNPLDGNFGLEASPLGPIASFNLPPLNPPHEGSRIFILPTPSMGSGAHNSIRPKIYDFLPQARIICLQVMVNNGNQSSLEYQKPAGLLYIPVSIFLSAACSDHQSHVQFENTLHGPITMPWNEWAHHTSWLDRSGFRQSSYWGPTYGHRIVSAYDNGRLSASTEDWLLAPNLDLILVDFNPRRVQQRQLVEKGLKMGTTAPWRDNDREKREPCGTLGYSIFCQGTASAQARYAGTLLQNIEGVCLADDVIADDERVLVVRAEEFRQGTSLSVYTC